MPIFVCSERSLPKTFNEKLSLELKRPSFPSWVKQIQYVFEISWSEITGIKCLEYLDPNCKIMGENGCIIWGGKIFRVLKLSQTRKLFPARPHSTACASRSGPFPLGPPLPSGASIPFQRTRQKCELIQRCSSWDDSLCIFTDEKLHFYKKVSERCTNFTEMLTFHPNEHLPHQARPPDSRRGTAR